MRKLLFVVILTGGAVQAQTLAVLDPGDGRQYLTNWCGGQSINEYANDFDTAGNPESIVVVSTRCSTGGRGSKSRTYMACWRVTFSEAGSILTKSFISSGSWLQGSPAIPCGVSYDPAAIFGDTDTDKLATTSFPTFGGAYPGPNYRAVLTH